MRRFLFLIAIPFVQTQIIDISVCSDTNCAIDCLMWTASGGQCTPCSGVCSNDNPSSITTTTSLSLYSDSICSLRIPDSYRIPINLDNQCHPLAIGSYKARNTTTVIWASIGAAFTLLIIIGCCIRMCWPRCCRKPESDIKDYVVPYSVQIVPMQQQPYIVPSYTQQYGIQNSYIVPYAKPVLIEPYKSGQDPYYQTPYLHYSSVPYTPGSAPYVSKPYVSASNNPEPSAPVPSAPYGPVASAPYGPVASTPYGPTLY